MNNDVLELLCCPDCRAPLAVHTRAEGRDDAIDCGVLRCRGNHAYPIINGVPVLFQRAVLANFLTEYDHAYIREHQDAFGSLALEAVLPAAVKQEVLRASENWSFQWRKYAKDIAGSVWAEDTIFFEHIPIPRTEFRGRVVLDAGCGAGRNSLRFREMAARIVGVDISKSVYAAQAFNNSRRVDFIQADLARLPLRDGVFDIIFSDHVLQHVDDIDAVFSEFRRTVMRGNPHHVAFNLYSKENNLLLTRVIEPIKRFFRNRVPNWVNVCMGNVIGLVLFCVIRGVYRPLHHVSRLYRFLPLGEHMTFWFGFSLRICCQTCYDLLHAPIANYYASADVDALCARARFITEAKQLLRQTLWVLRGSFGAIGVGER
jgi:SAM-dependent methyltransferase/uncharacterized protein YbaR (Trm112 family)